MNPNKVGGGRLIVGYLGIFWMLIGFIILSPLATLIAYPEEMDYARFFILPGVAAIVIGYFLSSLIRGKVTSPLERHQDSVLILGIWFSAILISSVPLLLMREYSLAQAFFEATSGFTTTGLTIVNVSEAPKILLMFRSLMQFYGGVGLVLVLSSVFFDKYGVRLYSAEGHGDQLLPNLVKTARLILGIYIVYILVGTAFYVIFGMSVFDGLNHAIASVSTGGFSTVPGSIGHYNSVGVEWVTIILMMLGSTNLVIHLLLVRRKFNIVSKDLEIRLFLVLTLIFFPLLSLSLTSNYQSSVMESLRFGLFQFVTAVTTTGFQTIDSFQSQNHFFITSVIILMIIGGGLGTTAGALKQYRVGLMLKHLVWNFKQRVSHRNMVTTWHIQRHERELVMDASEVSHNYAHIMIYVLTLMVGTWVFTFYGFSFEESLFEFASALGTVGLSIGVLTAASPPLMLWVASIGMFLGRLEFFVIFIALSRLYLDWKGYRTSK